MMAQQPKRAALYLRVSTGEQTTDNQRRELEVAAQHKGWVVTEVFEDAGISGAKGRDQRPGLDRLLKQASLQRKRFDVVMCWSVDRLGRSLVDLVSGLKELHEAKIDLFLLQQNVDTTTPAGKAMFQMMGVFAEFERAMIQERIKTGFARVKETGKTKTGRMPGRPRVDEEMEGQIRAQLTEGIGMLRIGKNLNVGTKVVQRIAAEMNAQGAAVGRLKTQLSPA